jgi:hypothetical protein
MPTLPLAFDMYLIVFLEYLINVPVHTCTVFYSIHQIQVRYLTKVPIHQASSDPCSGRSSARCWGWGWGRGVRYWTLSSQQNRSGSGGSGSAGNFMEFKPAYHLFLGWYLHNSPLRRHLLYSQPFHQSLVGIYSLVGDSKTIYSHLPLSFLLIITPTRHFLFGCYTHALNLLIYKPHSLLNLLVFYTYSVLIFTLNHNILLG